MDIVQHNNSVINITDHCDKPLYDGQYTDLVYVVVTPSRYIGFEYRPKQWISWYPDRFLWFYSVPPGKYLDTSSIRRDPFFQIIIHLSYNDIIRIAMHSSYWQSRKVTSPPPKKKLKISRFRYVWISLSLGLCIMQFVFICPASCLLTWAFSCFSIHVCTC